MHDDIDIYIFALKDVGDDVKVTVGYFDYTKLENEHLQDYHKLNDNLDIVRITNGSLYPHMEIPEKINSLIEDYIQ